MISSIPFILSTYPNTPSSWSAQHSMEKKRSIPLSLPYLTFHHVTSRNALYREMCEISSNYIDFHAYLDWWPLMIHSPKFVFNVMILFPLFIYFLLSICISCMWSECLSIGKNQFLKWFQTNKKDKKKTKQIEQETKCHRPWKQRNKNNFWKYSKKKKE